MLIAFGVGLTLAFSLLCALVLYNIGQRDRASAEKAAANVVATLTTDISRNFQLYELSLEAVREGLAVPAIWSMRDDVRRLILFDRATTAKHLGDIFAVDAAGRVIINSNVSDMAGNRSSEDYFQFHKDSDSRDTFISSPKTVRGNTIINVSRRMVDDDGAFAGVIVGSIELGYFQDLIRQITLGDTASLSVLKTDGAVIYRSPAGGFNSFAKSPVFQKLLAARSGTFEAPGLQDSKDRVFVYSRVGDLPLIVSYSQTIDAVYAGARHDALAIGSIMLVLSLVNFGLIVFLASTLKRRSDAEYTSTVTANTDGLTGICNRRRFDEIFDQNWSKARTEQSEVAVLMIDADHFKTFNDSFGHQSGDKVLKTIAETIASVCAGDNCLCARYGGEEFIVALFKSSRDEAAELAEAIRAKINALREYQRYRPDCCPTLSIGYASITPVAGLRPDDLVAAADIALYEAKRRGRDCAVSNLSLGEMSDKAKSRETAEFAKEKRATG